MKKIKRVSGGRSPRSSNKLDNENVITAINEHDDQKVDSSFQKKIRNLISSCKQWISCDCSLIQKDATTNFKLALLLYRGSLEKPVLQLTNTESGPPPNIGQNIDYNAMYGNSIFVPVNKLAIPKILFNQLFLIFEFSDPHSGCVLVFKINNKDRQFEILTSQLRICRQISKLVTEFNSEVNETFLRKYSYSGNDSIDNISFLKKMTLFDIEDVNCICFPVPYVQETMHIWSERSTNRNTVYFAEAQELRVCCITWNVASRNPDCPEEDQTENPENEVDFENQIIEFINDKKEKDHPSDILFFAFQEIDMGFRSVVSGNSDLCDNWKELIHRALVSAHQQYEFKHCTSLGGVFTAVAVRKNIVDKFGYNLRVELKNDPQMIRLGFGGKLANKSAIVYTIEAGNTARIMLIGCHLTAHQEAKEERDKELRDLSALMYADRNIEIASSGNSSSAFNLADFDEQDFNENETFRGIDYFILEGDLNYRIDLTKQETMNLISKRDIRTLLDNDQLNHSRSEDPVIEKLKEGRIKFLPTYKFERGTQNYDDGPKQRVPSYTDRVLYMKNDKSRLYLKGIDRKSSIDDNFFVFDTDYGGFFAEGSKLIKTKCHTGIPDDVSLNYPVEPVVSSYKRGTCSMSDHRPVKAIIDFIIPVISPDKERHFQELKLKKLDEMIALSTPTLNLVYKEVEVKEKGTLELEFTNNSYAWAQWQVKAQNDDFKKNCIIAPIQGVALPGKSFVIKINAKEKTKKGNPAVFNIENSQTGSLLTQLNITVV